MAFLSPTPEQKYRAEERRIIAQSNRAACGVCGALIQHRHYSNKDRGGSKSRVYCSWLHADHALNKEKGHA